jgi:hypothetical protein
MLDSLTLHGTQRVPHSLNHTCVPLEWMNCGKFRLVIFLGKC